VRLGLYRLARSIAAINPKSSIVFVMNHRSNMDYVLVAFLAAERVRCPTPWANGRDLAAAAS